MIDYPDHHDYGPGDWEKILAAGRDADMILTTEKDLVKLERFSPPDAPLYALRLQVAMAEPDETRLINMALQQASQVPTANIREGGCPAIPSTIQGGPKQWR
jgi:tetraacyldisaccharide-1-P 4'-kinase